MTYRLYIPALLLNLISLIALAQTEEPIRLNTGSLVLDGTLILPANATKLVPVVLLIAGSGPTDRDGNISVPAGRPNGVKAGSYRMLADSLAKLGVAVVRYDKRGVGRSVWVDMSEKNLTFETYIQDATAWLDQLRADKRFSRFAVVGHSEGSLIGMVAAHQTKANAFVSLAGPGSDIATKLKAQLGSQLPETARQSVFNALDSLKAGLEVTPPTQYPVIRQMFRPSVQPYMISWMKYDPAVQLRLLTIPVLIIQGKRDIQVMVADAELLKAARPDATMVLFDEMNHILKNAPADRIENFKTYSNPTLPLTPGLATAIADFVK